MNKNELLQNDLAVQKNKIISKSEYWISFIQTMSRHYKHSSAAQIIIHTQSPNSTACADANLWKNKFNRTVAGGKSIQVLTDDNTTSCLYDISQTCPISGKTAKMPWIWNLFDTTLKVSYSEAVKDGLIKKHSLSSAALPDCLSELCRKKTTEYLKEDSSDFFKLIYESASYCIKYRCCQNESPPCTETLSCLNKYSADTLINTVNHIVNAVFSDIESIILSEKRRLIENIRSNSHEHRNENNQRNTSREMSDNERISAGHDNGKRNDDDTGRKQVSVSPTGVQGDEAGRNNSEDEGRSHNASSSVGNSGENLQNGTRFDKRRVRSSSTGGTGTLLSDSGKTLERKGDTDSSLKVHHSLQKLSSEMQAGAIQRDDDKRNSKQPSSELQQPNTDVDGNNNRAAERRKSGISEGSEHWGLPDNGTAGKQLHKVSGRNSTKTAHAVNQDFQQLQLFGNTDTEPDIVMSDKVAESLPSAENTDPDVSVKTEESKTFEQSYNTAENTVVSLPEIITQTEVKEQSDKIEDFGKKIGGAKKDIWKTKYLTLSDITDWTEIEKEKYITKNNIWKAPDYQKLFDDGLPLYAVYFIKLVHDNLPAKPALNTQDFQNGYISVISDIRDKALQIKTEKDVRTFINGILNDYLINNKKNYGCFTNKFIRTKNTVYLLEQEISKKQFLYTDKQKALSNYCIYFYNGSNIAFEANRLEVHVNHGKHYFYDMQYNKKEKWIDNTYFVASKSHSILENNFSTLENAESFALQREQELSANKDKPKKKSRKRSLIPKQLQNVIRTGTDYRCGKDISGDDMLKTFGFYGGEFGNWENQIERQQNLNFSYEAFRDLAAALGIKDSDISLNGKLSIAFGARGKGNALAHFEPMRNVINLTKIKGAGSLAHEWGHAFDFFLASKIDTPFHFASQSNDDLIKPVIDSMIWKKLSPEENKALQLKLSEKCQKQFTDKVKHMFDYTNRSNNEKSDIDLAISQCISTFDESQYNLDSSGKFKFHDILNALTVKMNIKPMKFYSLNFYLIQSYAYMNENSNTECRMVHTDFYNDSVQMDKLYSKCDKGYWRSNIEMFARAFACYVADKLQPERSDYLCGHADSDFSVTEDKKIIYAFPRGTERETINKSFDKLFTLVKEREFLHTQEHETRSITQLTEKPSIRSAIDDIQKNQNPILQHSSKHQAISL